MYEKLKACSFLNGKSLQRLNKMNKEKKFVSTFLLVNLCYSTFLFVSTKPAPYMITMSVSVSVGNLTCVNFEIENNLK